MPNTANHMENAIALRYTAFYGGPFFRAIRASSFCVGFTQFTNIVHQKSFNSLVIFALRY